MHFPCSAEREEFGSCKVQHGVHRNRDLEVTTPPNYGVQLSVGVLSIRACLPFRRLRAAYS